MITPHLIEQLLPDLTDQHFAITQLDLYLAFLYTATARFPHFGYFWPHLIEQLLPDLTSQQCACCGERHQLAELLLEVNHARLTPAGEVGLQQQ
jgi:hypothetical protein